MKAVCEEAQLSVGLLEGGAALSDVIDNHIHRHALADKNAFVVADLGVVMKQLARWRAQMPAVRPFYSVRSNRCPAVIELLAALGTGFICANKSELQLVQRHGIPPDRIIYSAICKQSSHIRYAAKSGVDLLVCDNEAELQKIARCHPSARLLLQVSTEASGQEQELGMTFGCSLKDCRRLLEGAKELGVQVAGVRCHISTPCDNEKVYSHAITDARCVFDMAAAIGFHMSILDIGGSFSGSEAQLEQVNQAVMAGVEMYFPPSCGVSIVAEPGRYFVSSAFTLAVSVVSKELVARDLRDQAADEPSLSNQPAFQYGINEGVYGSFASKLMETLIDAPSVHKSSARDRPVFSSSLWGPSGDQLDRVVEHCLLPELEVGDWLVFPRAGAYSQGRPACPPDALPPPVYYVLSSTDWLDMQDTGVSQESTLKNFSLFPFLLSSRPPAAALSVPA